MTTYINYKGSEGRETVDEFDTRKEAQENLVQYRISNPAGEYYLSPRCCNNWKDTSQSS